jgi:hypothetical protein
MESEAENMWLAMCDWSHFPCIRSNHDDLCELSESLILMLDHEILSRQNKFLI